MNTDLRLRALAAVNDHTANQFIWSRAEAMAVLGIADGDTFRRTVYLTTESRAKTPNCTRERYYRPSDILALRDSWDATADDSEFDRNGLVKDAAAYRKRMYAAERAERERLKREQQQQRFRAQL